MIVWLPVWMEFVPIRMRSISAVMYKIRDYIDSLTILRNRCSFPDSLLFGFDDLRFIDSSLRRAGQDLSSCLCFLSLDPDRRCLSTYRTAVSLRWNFLEHHRQAYSSLWWICPRCQFCHKIHLILVHIRFYGDEPDLLVGSEFSHTHRRCMSPWWGDMNQRDPKAQYGCWICRDIVCNVTRFEYFCHDEVGGLEWQSLCSLRIYSVPLRFLYRHHSYRQVIWNACLRVLLCPDRLRLRLRIHKIPRNSQRD